LLEIEIELELEDRSRVMRDGNHRKALADGSVR
jgi:hypothetical protein